MLLLNGFALERRVGIGVTVPPSGFADTVDFEASAFMAAMEMFDRGFARPLAMLGDHVLYQFRRTIAI